MLQPVRCRTWAPRGETPIQRAWDRHDRLSVIGAISVSPVRRRLALFDHIHHRNVRWPQVVPFLLELHERLHRKIILVWDRSSVHRAAKHRLCESHPQWFDFEWLPPYAPELDPVEECWNHAKYCDLANFIPHDIDHLEHAVAHSLNQQRHDQQLLRSYFDYAELRL